MSDKRTRAPRNTLNPELIVTTALRLMAADGVEAFSLRALAKELGVGPMALYTYFRGKDELFDAVRDHLLGTRRLATAKGPWQQQIRSVATGLRELLLEYPCLLRILASRPLKGPETAAVTETLVRALREAGFSKENAARAYTMLFTFVLGAALWESQMNAEKQDPEGRRRLRATMASLSEVDYPTVVDLAGELAATSGGDAQFEFGLRALVAGLEPLLD
ncbi:TetR/AcrR family transcriptional regulator [Allokutzneria sp. A3M-2-11 16]|uniref:TetR/AcrR family transcriptional regulator n=1 Tax=Allokutzneria sp. A3M-2-11 16 TaxID=2962043 RepID=UPI0020B7378F|nr:TetR/AcrR family transcriptional regulator [Allokutzneria sp. A3M-2-11 16]MCP3801475.1 TetR/AcrR family transcriptional regulator [Allokutzneria sp. A3M-2-11 16]